MKKKVNEVPQIRLHHKDKKIDRRKDVRAYMEEASRIIQMELEKDDCAGWNVILKEVGEKIFLEGYIENLEFPKP